MSNTILTLSEEPAARWVEALDPVVLRSSITGVRITSSVTYWLDFSTLDFDEALSFIDRIVVANDAVPIVCMVPFPKDEDAFALLARGARGYCHVAAAPAQLRLVADTVKNGGFWLPASLLRRVMASAGGLVSQISARKSVSLDDLTKRERQVAQAVSDGLSNREIAERLSISERTVKARLTSVFQKVDVRDRVQLALLLRGGPA
ncbi:MAG: DNA-binding response regulator [Gammaproteobacteria bacterium]|nr:DNA-binding response regulator [Gammaproteobacteria bacterium]